MRAPIRISFNGRKIVCRPDRGNAWIRDGDVTWKIGNSVTKFKLDFYREDMQDNRASSDWPFDRPAPDPAGSSSTGWTTEFTGTVKDEPGVYKYVVEIEHVDSAGQSSSHFLDPMIIVGRG